MHVIKSGVIYEVAEGAEKEFVSTFAEEIFQQDTQSWGHEAWKFKDSEGDLERGLVPRSMLWGGGGKIKQPVKVKANYVYGAPGRIYYVLEMKNSWGLFHYDFARNLETRLFHKADFRPRGLFVGEDYSILTTVTNSDGTVHLVQLDSDGKREQAITSGDCVDENPFRHGSLIYYQSSGIARNTEGLFMANGPAAINTLDVNSGEVETILSSEKYDYLLPRVAKDGTLYCIQVPYHSQEPYALATRLVDIVLFPWRMCVAIFAFLNVFSIFFAKKPLTSAGGPNLLKADISRRILHNRVVNLQETMRRERKKVAVSRDWKLVRVTDGKVAEIASNVLWFEMDGRGLPVYTDGYRIFDNTGKKQFECDELVSGIALATT